MVIFTRRDFSPFPVSARIAFPFSSCMTSFTVRLQISCALAPLEYITDRRTRSRQPSFSVGSGSEKRISNSVRVKELRCFPFTRRKDFFAILARLLWNTQPASRFLHCAYSAKEDNAPIRCFAVVLLFFRTVTNQSKKSVNRSKFNISNVIWPVFISVFSSRYWNRSLNAHLYDKIVLGLAFMETGRYSVINFPSRLRNSYSTLLFLVWRLHLWNQSGCKRFKSI